MEKWLGRVKWLLVNPPKNKMKNFLYRIINGPPAQPEKVSQWRIELNAIYKPVNNPHVDSADIVDMCYKFIDVHPDKMALQEVHDLPDAVVDIRPDALIFFGYYDNLRRDENKRTFRSRD